MKQPSILKNKKGLGLGDLPKAAIAFVFIAIVVGVGADVLGDIRADQTAGSYEENATVQGLQSLDTLASWLPTIALVIAAAIVIGVLAMFRSG